MTWASRSVKKLHETRLTESGFNSLRVAEFSDLRNSLDNDRETLLELSPLINQLSFKQAHVDTVSIRRRRRSTQKGKGIVYETSACFPRNGKFNSTMFSQRVAGVCESDEKEHVRVRAALLCRNAAKFPDKKPNERAHLKQQTTRKANNCDD